MISYNKCARAGTLTKTKALTIAARALLGCHLRLIA
jgi:hypothetical protein